MMRLFEEESFARRMGQMFLGLGKPKDSGEYKFARLQLQRLSAPFLGVAVPVALLAGMLAIQTQVEVVAITAPVEIIEEQTVELDDIEPLQRQELTMDMEVMVDYATFDTPSISVADAMVDVSAVLSDSSPMPKTIPQIKSTIMMRGIQTTTGKTANRSAASRGRAMQAFGGSAETEAAVLNALRWYMTQQNPDGSWGKDGFEVPMTAFAILCFLGRGELPHTSAEFGDAVQRGLIFLVESIKPNGLFAVPPGSNYSYSHAIAAYALCEAYSMTRNPIFKDAIERALVPIIQGQHPTGGWDYNLAQSDRNDLSFAGWCAQAIAAGYSALGQSGIYVLGLEKAYQMVAPGVKTNYGQAADRSRGGFGYVGPDPNSGLTAVGVLALQLTGHARAPETRAGLNTLDTWTVGWDDTSFGAKPGAGQYYFYYATQCMFHEGGQRWTRWNNAMKPAYTRAQTVIPAQRSGYVDHLGQPQAIGYWDYEEAHTMNDGFLFRTAIVTLQLEVYYRYLPTYQPVTVIDSETILENPDDIDILINF